jgi:hypothetical protein
MTISRTDPLKIDPLITIMTSLMPTFLLQKQRLGE